MPLFNADGTEMDYVSLVMTVDPGSHKETDIAKWIEKFTIPMGQLQQLQHEARKKEEVYCRTVLYATSRVEVMLCQPCLYTVVTNTGTGPTRHTCLFSSFCFCPIVVFHSLLFFRHISQTKRDTTVEKQPKQQQNMFSTRFFPSHVLLPLPTTLPSTNR